MSSSESDKCAICRDSVEGGQGKAIFTAECSHSFHFTCIANSVKHGHHRCPLCRADWDHLPSVLHSLAPIETNSTIDHHPIADLSIDDVDIWPTLERLVIDEPEPLQFLDDDPTADPVPTASSAHLQLQNVRIWSIPERQAIPASESVPHFAVLVGLKALSPRPQPQRAPIDLVAVVDVSGSMHGSKLALLKRAMNFVFHKLGPSDRLSIVSFSTTAQRVFPLRRMTAQGRIAAGLALNRLIASGRTNIVDGLRKGVRVLEERRHHNPVSSILFLSDGRDTCQHSPNIRALSNSRQPPSYLHLLPPSICPRNRGTEDASQQQIFPVRAFSVGSDNDPVAMQAISDSSGGIFSNTLSYGFMERDFDSCITGFMSVAIQELRLTVAPASHGVKIMSIPSGQYATEVRSLGCQGTISVGNLYADEEKQFLINISVPTLPEGGERRTSLLDVTCSYIDAVSREPVQVEGDPVQILRPDTANLEADRQMNRHRVSDCIVEAHRMAEAGNVQGARLFLSNTRALLLSSPTWQRGDSLCMRLEAELKDFEDILAYMQTITLASPGRASPGLVRLGRAGLGRAGPGGY